MVLHSYGMLVPCGVDMFRGTEYVCCPSSHIGEAIPAPLPSQEDDEEEQIEDEEVDLGEPLEDRWALFVCVLQKVVTPPTHSHPLLLSEPPADEEPTPKEVRVDEDEDEEEDEDEYHYVYEDEEEDKEEEDKEEEKKDGSKMSKDQDEDKIVEEVKGLWSPAFCPSTMFGRKGARTAFLSSPTLTYCSIREKIGSVDDLLQHPFLYGISIIVSVVFTETWMKCCPPVARWSNALSSGSGVHPGGWDRPLPRLHAALALRP